MDWSIFILAIRNGEYLNIWIFGHQISTYVHKRGRNTEYTMVQQQQNSSAGGLVDLYDVLDVPKTATTKEVRRRKCLIYTQYVLV